MGDDCAAVIARIGAEVDEIVGIGDDVEIVLDDDEGIFFVGELMEDLEELQDVFAVEADGGLIDEVEGFARFALGELAREAEALRFAARERGELLAELEIGEADG